MKILAAVVEEQGSPFAIEAIHGGPEFSLEAAGTPAAARAARGIVEGDSVPPHFLPRLYSFWQEGRFPVERMMTFYDFEQIEQAARDAESGAVIKPVLRMSERSK